MVSDYTNLNIRYRLIDWLIWLLILVLTCLDLQTVTTPTLTNNTRNRAPPTAPPRASPMLYSSLWPIIKSDNTAFLGCVKQIEAYKYIDEFDISTGV